MRSKASRPRVPATAPRGTDRPSRGRGWRAARRGIAHGCVLATLAGSTLGGVTWLQKIVAPDGQPEDQFGRAVALSGGTLAISSPLDDDGALQAGSIYIFDRGSSAWNPTTKLVATDPRPHQLLGFGDLALDGARLLAGAPGDSEIATQAGAAYLFEDSASGWYESAKLAASDATALDGFGWAVALDGTTAVVSAYLADTAYTDAGAVYVFEEEASGWVEQERLTASDGFASDLFGYRVDLDGDRLVVSSPWDDDRGSRSGSVYVFERTAGSWTQSAKLAPTALRAGDQFGYDVSLDGNRLAVGAAFADAPEQDSGRAYVLALQGGSWSVEATLQASEPAAFDGFGSHVALDDRALLVTSELDDNEMGVDAGSATMFLRCRGTWREHEVLQAFDGHDDDLYAADVALDDGIAVLGASRDDEPAGDEGSAYLYRADVPIGTPYCVASPNSTGVGATLCAVGSPRIADAALTLVAENLPAGVPGLFYFAADQVQFPFGDGVRCAGGGPHHRMWPFAHADAGGRVEYPFQWGGVYATHVVPGTPMNFQLWYRDLAAGGAGFNLTDGVEVPFE